MSITKISPDVVDFDDGITITVNDNSAALTLKSTDTDASIGPILDLSRDNSSAADGDVTGTIRFVSDDDANNQTTYVQLVSKIVDASNSTEDGSFHIESVVAGSTQQRMDVLAGETVFNEGSQDLDFRVESDGNAKALVILGDKYGLGVGRDPENAYNGYTSIELGQQTTIIANDAGDDVALLINAFLDSSGNWIRKETGVAGNLNLDGDQLKYFTAASGSADSTITFAQTLRIDTDGIKFGSAPAAANALDDYEEGTWTPGSLPGTIGTVTHAHYTKIGRLVHWTCIVEAFSDTSTNASITLTGLPFPVYRNQAAGSVFGIQTSETGAVVTYCNDNERVFFYTMSSGTWNTMGHNELSSGHAFYAQGTYHAE